MTFAAANLYILGLLICAHESELGVPVRWLLLQKASLRASIMSYSILAWV